ncbi:MAG: acyltransferase [Hellea sp.]
MTNQLSKPYGHSEYFAALDGFRGLLALFVAVYHTIWFSHLNSLAFFNNGAVIIDLFFALSGFLMFRLYDGKLKDGADAKDFMKRRFARIYPLHFFMLAIFVAFAVLRLVAHKVGIATHDVGEILPFTAGAQEGWGSLLSNLTLTHAMGVNNSLTFNPPAWTISAEFFTYFVFVAVMLRARPTKLIHFIGLGAIVVLIYAGLSKLKPNLDITYDYAFFRCVAGFFTGVIAAKIFDWLKPKADKLKTSGKALLFSGLEAVTLIGSTLFVIYCGGKMQFFAAPLLLGFMVVFAFDGGIVSRFMGSKPFLYLAKISYSTYMTHVIISIAFSIFGNKVLGALMPSWNEGGWGGDMLLAVYLCAVICFSHLTYHFIEVPGRRFIRNYKHVKTAKPVTKPA